MDTGNTGFTDQVQGDIVGTGSGIEAKVSELGNHNGLVMTCPLLPDSPALDTGDDALPGAPLNLSQDGGGFARKSGAHVDIGAYEYQWPSLPLACHTIVAGDVVQLVATNAPGAVFTVVGTDDLTQPVTDWPVLGQMIEIAPGQLQWTDTDSANYSQRFFTLRNP